MFNFFEKSSILKIDSPVNAQSGKSENFSIDNIIFVTAGVNCSSEELPHIANPRSDVSLHQWDRNFTYFEIQIR